MSSVFKINATGAAGLAASMTVPAGETYKLISVSLLMSAAPTTSEDFTITLDAKASAPYDVLLYTLDLASGSITNLVWFPDEVTLLEGGDAIDVAYTNTDTGTYGLQITAEAI